MQCPRRSYYAIPANRRHARLAGLSFAVLPLDLSESAGFLALAQ